MEGTSQTDFPRGRPRAGTLPSLPVNPAVYTESTPTWPLLPLGATSAHPSQPLQRQRSALSPYSSSALGPSLATSYSTPSSARISPNASLVPSPVLAPADGNMTAPNRLRSGSLTLQMPKSSVADAFGPGVFSGSWTPSLEELKSVKSDESITSGSIQGDTEHVKTLNYLGLDDPASPPRAPLRRQPSLDANMHAIHPVTPAATRLRANTVATPPNSKTERTTDVARRKSSSQLLSLIDIPETSNQAEQESVASDFASLSLDSSDPTSSQFYYPQPSNGADHIQALFGGAHKQNPYSRPRASTTAALADMHLAQSNASLRRRAGTTSQLNLVAQAQSQGGQEELYTFDDASGSSHSGGSALHMTPTRSLWIGNLQEPELSSADLFAIFSAYGGIDSIRILPEKLCAFVNYTNVHSAIAAKEDIINRLGGRLHPNSHATVRIGYGKPDSVPTTPAQPITAAFEAALQSSPTRALWIGSLPPAVTTNELLSLFSQFGPIESARVLTHKSCGFVNMERLDDAVRARKALFGRELFGGEAGPIKIGFAKVPSPARPVEDAASFGPSLSTVKGASAVPLDQQIYSGAPLENYRSSLLLGLAANEAPHPASAAQALQNAVNMPPAGPAPDGPLLGGADEAPRPSTTDLQLLMKELSGPQDPELETHLRAVAELPAPATYYSTVPPVLTSENGGSKKRSLEAPALRDMRKRIDSGVLSMAEIDGLAAELIDDAAQVAADYIGNTIVQKFFEKCSPGMKLALLERIAPHLASIGCHKNGTWAAQKIIDCASSPEEVILICRHLQPYVPPLLLDQYGNYVVQCALRFGSPATDGIFDAMANRCWAIGQGRFGARSMRTVLESPFIPRLQQKRVAISIILNAIPLATNPNGALLLTWLLDTSNFKGRYKLLAPRFATHLSHLCIHKVASTTILRLVNQRADPTASQLIINGIFESENDTILDDILNDQMHGIAFIQKLLSCPYVLGDPPLKGRLVDKVKASLARLHADQAPAFQRMLSDIVNGSPSHGLDRSPNQQPNAWLTPSQVQPSYARGGSASFQSQGQGPPRSTFNPWPPGRTASPAARSEALPQHYSPSTQNNSNAPLYGGSPAASFYNTPQMHYAPPFPQGTPPSFYPSYSNFSSGVQPGM